MYNQMQQREEVGYFGKLRGMRHCIRHKHKMWIAAGIRNFSL